MSKVYSFRLNDDNPREAQAREVIIAWVAEWYSLRYIVAEALNSYSRDNEGDQKFYSLLEHFEEIFLKIEKDIDNPNVILEKPDLPSPFIMAVKNSVKSGVRSS